MKLRRSNDDRRPGRRRIAAILVAAGGPADRLRQSAAKKTRRCTAAHARGSRGRPNRSRQPTSKKKQQILCLIKEDPIRFNHRRMDRSKLVISGRVQSRRGQPDVPTQEITVPLRLVSDGGRMAIACAGGRWASRGRWPASLRSGAIKAKDRIGHSARAALSIHKFTVPRPGRPDVDLTGCQTSSADNGWLTDFGLTDGWRRSFR